MKMGYLLKKKKIRFGQLVACTSLQPKINWSTVSESSMVKVS